MPNVSGYFSIGQVDRSKTSTATTSTTGSLSAYGKVTVSSSVELKALTSAVSRRKESHNKSFFHVTSSGSGLVTSKIQTLLQSAQLVFERKDLSTRNVLAVLSSGQIIDGLYRDSPEFLLDKSGTNSIGTYKKFFTLSSHNTLSIQPKYRVYGQNTLGHYNNTTESGTGSITLLDENPFLVVNRIPEENTVLVDPNTSVEFTLLDESTGIDENSVNITIDGVELVIGGDVQSGSWELTKTSQIAGPPPNSIRYVYTPASPFEEGKDITVDIFGQDFASPAANVTNLSYQFRIWNGLNFPGLITIDPDLDAPYLTNIVPASGGTDWQTCQPISFDILDDTTGIDLSYLSIEVDGQVVFSGTTISNSLTITPVSKGYHVVYDTGELSFGKQYDIRVKARDNYKPSRHYLDSHYTFSTVDNDSIVISNFFISDVGSSLLILPDTEITVDITDSIYGIDISGSKLFINGQEVSFSSTSITNGYILSVNASTLLDQVDFVHVKVRAQNLRDSECPVYKEQDFKLSFGYKVTVLPEKYYKYNEDVYQLLIANSIDRNPSTLSEPIVFTTHPISTKELGAFIDTRRRTKDLGGYIAPIGPRFYYNKTITVRVEAKDLDGNEMAPFEFTYKIENKPE